MQLNQVKIPPKEWGGALEDIATYGGELEILLDLLEWLLIVGDQSDIFSPKLLDEDDCIAIFNINSTEFKNIILLIASGKSVVTKAVFNLNSSDMLIFVKLVFTNTLVYIQDSIYVLSFDLLSSSIFSGVMGDVTSFGMNLNVIVMDGDIYALTVLNYIEENKMEYKCIENYYDILYEEYSKGFDYYTIKPTIYTILNPVEGDIIFTTPQGSNSSIGGNQVEALRLILIIGNFIVTEDNPKTIIEYYYHNSEYADAITITDPGKYEFEIKNLNLSINKIINYYDEY